MSVKSFFLIISSLTYSTMSSSLGINQLGFTRIPDVNEQSILASGPFIKTENETGLRKVMPTKYLQLHNSNTVLTSEPCIKKLKDLVRVVEGKFHKKYNLIILAGHKRFKWSYLAVNSLHYEGRALDLKLKRRDTNTDKAKDVINSKAKIDRIHHRLAWFAYHEASFSFAKVSKNHHGEHVHVSCKRV